MMLNLLTRISWAGVAGTGSVFIWNATEYLRMARNIQQNNLAPRQDKALDPEFCQFPIPAVSKDVKGAPNRFCGIVGVKATGKTSTLKLMAKEFPNVVYLELRHGGDICDAIYDELKASVWSLPWFLDRLRLDSSLTTMGIVMKVFDKVKEASGTPVTTLIDINPTKPTGIPQQVPSVSSLGVFERVVRDGPQSLVPSFSFDAQYFTRQIKLLVGSGVMQCLFAATEGVNFQAEAIREPRLRLYMASELPLDISTKYLQEKFGVPSNNEVIEQLRKFPRIFTNLELFAEEQNKQLFVNIKFASEKAKIEKTLVKNLELKKVYELALKQEINLYQLKKEHKFTFSEDEFIKLFVESNIFVRTPKMTYKFQFDATATAAAQVCNE